MSDNYLEMLLKELVKNGVSLRKPPFNPDKFTVDELEIEAVQLEPFNFLDFSEHDKVFEDKIASFEENVGYYKDSLSRVEKNCDKLYHENKELKQRIAELESKETEKPTKYTTVIVAKEINGQTYVTLEDFMSVVNYLQAQIGT